MSLGRSHAAASVRFTGLDDVNVFYTADAEQALRAPSDAAVSVALVHSPELADIAANAGYALYLAGHTHGGAICPPGGRPGRHGWAKSTEWKSAFTAGTRLTPSSETSATKKRLSADPTIHSTGVGSSPGDIATEWTRNFSPRGSALFTRMACPGEMSPI